MTVGIALLWGIDEAWADSDQGQEVKVDARQAAALAAGTEIERELVAEDGGDVTVSVLFCSDKLINLQDHWHYAGRPHVLMGGGRVTMESALKSTLRCQSRALLDIGELRVLFRILMRSLHQCCGTCTHQPFYSC